VPFTAAKSSRLQNPLDADPSDPRRTCVVATNIAETLITVPDAVYVIDVGLERPSTTRLGLALKLSCLASSPKPVQCTGGSRWTDAAG
jgi:hypothetical protein